MESYDDPRSFRGQLQRGRGIAFREARNRARAGEAVYECVIDDPRWDRQAESRDTYLADLIRTLGLPLTPIEEHLTAFDDDDPDDIGLLLSVVAELAAAGHDDAIGVLRRYVTGGEHWSAALAALVFAESADVLGVRDQLIDEALGCRTDAELEKLVDDGDDEWMQPALERHPRLQRFHDKSEESPEQRRAEAIASRRRLVQSMADTPRDELLRQVAHEPGRRRWALEELGRRGDQTVLDLVEDPGLRTMAGWIPGARQALKHLGAAAVPRARQWLSGDDLLAALGLRVLADAGDRRDVPGLISALERAFNDDDLWCAAETPAEGLGRLQVAEAAPLLLAAWEKSVHSFARRRFLPALHSCAPRVAESVAAEGLDDCEPSVRDIAREISRGIRNTKR